MTMPRFHIYAALTAVLLGAAPAHAQQQMVIIDGKIQISPSQKLILLASQKVAAREFREAESLYTQAIALDGSDADAYLHRGVVRREQGNMGGAQSDARAAIMLSNNVLQQNPGDATAYYQRGNGFRLLREYAQAKSDVQQAINLGGDPNWRTDLRDIALEEKARQ